MSIFEKKNMQEIIEKTWNDRNLLSQVDIQVTIRAVIDKLDKGELRVAQLNSSEWIVNEWIKKAVILYFSIQKLSLIESNPFTFFLFFESNSNLLHLKKLKFSTFRKSNT